MHGDRLVSSHVQCVRGLHIVSTSRKKSILILTTSAFYYILSHERNQDSSPDLIASCLCDFVRFACPLTSECLEMALGLETST